LGTNPAATSHRRSVPRSRELGEHDRSTTSRNAPSTARIDIIAVVPRISAFHGIVIWMYHDEIRHLGRPHFHASYADHEASVDIETGAVIAGGLPRRAKRLVAEWASLHRAELHENWALARQHQPLNAIDPLP
jgi:hypothetical protein